MSNEKHCEATEAHALEGAISGNAGSRRPILGRHLRAVDLTLALSEGVKKVFRVREKPLTQSRIFGLCLEFVLCARWRAQWITHDLKASKTPGLYPQGALMLISASDVIPIGEGNSQGFLRCGAFDWLGAASCSEHHGLSSSGQVRYWYYIDGIRDALVVRDFICLSLFDQGLKLGESKGSRGFWDR
jgi:hypothetical protein